MQPNAIMAATLNFKFLANDKGLRDGINRSKKQLNGLQKTTRGIGMGMKSALGGLGIGLGIAAITRELVDATKAAAADAKSQKLLALQMKTTVNATDKQIASTEDYIGKLSQATGIVDDDLRPAFAKLVRSTGSVRKSQKLLNIALDGSAASGKPLTTVIDALSKAENGNLTSLYRLAPQLKKVKGGIDDYAKSVKGAKEANADPFAKFQVAVDNINESLGRILLPAVEDLAKWFTKDIAPRVEEFFKALNDPKTDIGKLYKELSDSLGSIFTSLGEIADSKAFKVMAEFASGVTIEAFRQLADYMNQISTAFAVISGDTQGAVKALGKTKLGQAGLAIAGQISGTPTAEKKEYIINIMKSNMSPRDMLREIMLYERRNGKKVLK